MKKLIKEICIREGKKSQTSRANVMETISTLQDVLAEKLADKNQESSEYIIEFLNALQKKAAKAFKKNKLIVSNVRLDIEGYSMDPKPEAPTKQSSAVIVPTLQPAKKLVKAKKKS